MNEDELALMRWDDESPHPFGEFPVATEPIVSDNRMWQTPGSLAVASPSP